MIVLKSSLRILFSTEWRKPISSELNKLACVLRSLNFGDIENIKVGWNYRHTWEQTSKYVLLCSTKVYYQQYFRKINIKNKICAAFKEYEEEIYFVIRICFICQFSSHCFFINLTASNFVNFRRQSSESLRWFRKAISSIPMPNFGFWEFIWKT